MSVVSVTGMDTGRVDPRVGSGRVGSGPNFRQIWLVGSGRVEISEIHYFSLCQSA